MSSAFSRTCCEQQHIERLLPGQKPIWSNGTRMKPGILCLSTDSAKSSSNSVDKKKLSEGAKTKLQAYGWRGNIRELENTMHRAILISMEDELEADAIHLQGGVQSAADAAAQSAANITNENTQPSKAGAGLDNPGGVETLVGRTIADVERDMIINTLEHYLGNRTHAANILGISIRTLRNKINAYKDDGVTVPASNG